MKLGNFGEMPTINIDVLSTPVMQPVKKQAAKPTMGLENQFLDFEKNKVQVLTLDQLCRTNKENRGDNHAKPHDIYHYEMIERMLDMCAKHGYNAEVYDLFATNNSDKQTPGVSVYPELEAKYGQRAIPATTLRRVYANVRLTNFDDDKLTTNLALSYTQKGIQVGFGSMVKVCHNQNLLGRGRFVADYTISNHYTSGEEYKTDLPGIFGKIDSWLEEAESTVFKERKKIEQMKNTEVSPAQLLVIIGMLTATRVMHDTQNKKIRTTEVYPLNQTQINKFTENLLVLQKDNGHVSAWDLYNVATELYKPSSCEQNMILPQNVAMYNYLHEKCELI